ncbi:MAG: IclR family transcriptional regulator [Anaerolineaceae bacterium]|nr:IclR family transcriptional regulator [Anaerolineaceae bacterium]
MKNIPDEKQPNQTVAKALEVLDAFSAEHTERGIRELGRELGINPTTVFRIVRTLCNAGYLEQNKGGQSYSLGPKVLRLATSYSFHNPLPAVAKKVFEGFSNRFEHNLFLGTLSQFEVIYLAVLVGRGPIKIAVEPGQSFPLYSTAMGKVLLAHADDGYVGEFLKKVPLRVFTSRTLSTPQALLQQLEEIREKGYAINDGEQYDAIGAVGVPLYKSGDPPINLAVSLTYPRHLVQDGRLNIEELIALGREIVSEIARRSDMSNWS